MHTLQLFIRVEKVEKNDLYYTIQICKLLATTSLHYRYYDGNRCDLQY